MAEHPQQNTALPASAAARRKSPYPPVPQSHKWGLFAILVVAALLRLHGLGGMSLWYDEAHSLFYGQFADLQGSLMAPRNMTEPPVMALLARLWYDAIQGATELSPLSPASDFLIRLLPCLFSVLGVYAIYLAARVLTHDNGASLAAALFCAISPFQVYYGQELRIYSFYMALSLALVFFLVRAMEEDRVRWWAALAAAEALLLYTHFAGVWTLLLINVTFIVCLVADGWRARMHFFAWYATQAVAFVLSLPAIVLLLRAQHHVSRIEVPWYQFDLSWKTALITFKVFFAGYGFTVWAYWVLFALAGLLTVLGLAALRKRPGPLLLVVLLAAGPVALNFLLWKDREFSLYHHRMFIFSGAMTYVLAGAGLHALQKPRMIAAAVALLIGFTLPGLRDHYAERLHPVEVHRAGIYTHSDFRAAAAHIVAQWQEGDALAAANHFVIPSLRHYLRREPLRLCTEPWELPLMMQSHGHDALLYRQRLMPQLAAVALRGYDRVWFVESMGVTFEHKPHTDAVRAWLDAHYTALDDKAFYGLRVTLYAKTEATESRVEEAL
jgi:hypothetical protein